MARAHEEEDMRLPILEVLEGAGRLTTQEITRAVRSRLRLLPGDTEPARKRPNEQKIDQVIANALQQGRPLCQMDLIARVARGVFEITPIGAQHLERFRKEFEASKLLLDDIIHDEEE